MSIKSSFPTDQPSLVLDFANSRRLDPRITFTRAQTGNISSYTAQDGIVKYAGPNQPRFDHIYNFSTGEIESLGLLIEESRTNFYNVFDSSTNQFININPLFIDITPTSSTNPNGSSAVAYTATKSGDVNRFHGMPGGSIAVASTTTMTFSTWVKDFNSSNYRLYCILNARNPSTSNSNYLLRRFLPSTGSWIDSLSIGSVWSNASSTITPYPDGWYRVSITGTYTFEAGRTQLDFGFQILNENNLQFFDPPTANTHGLFLWGPQAEVGAFLTSYIPTVNNTVTRSADNSSMAGLGFSRWFNKNEGTMFTSFRTNLSVTQNIWSINNHPNSEFGTSINYWRLLILNNNEIHTQYNVGLVNQYPKFTLLEPENRVAQTFKPGTIITASRNGIVGSGLLDSYSTAPSPNKLEMALNIDSRTPLGSYTISKLAFYPQRLLNSELESLTK